MLDQKIVVTGGKIEYKKHYDVLGYARVFDIARGMFEDKELPNLN